MVVININNIINIDLNSSTHVRCIVKDDVISALPTSTHSQIRLADTYNGECVMLLFLRNLPLTIICLMGKRITYPEFFKRFWGQIRHSIFAKKVIDWASSSKAVAPIVRTFTVTFIDKRLNCKNLSFIKCSRVGKSNIHKWLFSCKPLLFLFS